MAFKLANISGKAALVKGEHYYDLKVISNNTFDEDTLNALNRLDELHELNGTLDEKTPTGLLEEAKIDAPISSPKNCYAVSCTHSALASFHTKPDSQAIASMFSLLCLAQFPANKADEVIPIIKILVDRTFIKSPSFFRLSFITVLQSYLLKY